MPLTQFDDKAALIMIDLQKGVAAMPTAHPMGQIIERSAKLAGAFRKRGLPVVLVNVTAIAPGRTDAGMPKFSFPPDWTDLAPDLAARDTDCRVSKQRWGAFVGTDLHEFLRGHGITQVFIIGVATSAGVESTARSAHDHGYNVVLVTDAMTDRDEDAHRYCVEKLFPRMSETASTDQVLSQLSAKKVPVQ